MVIERVLLIFHLTASIIWIGAVFMGSFIDYPVLKRIAVEKRFPFDFIVGQGTRVFGAVYFGAASMVFSSIGLVWLHPPTDSMSWSLLGVKTLALAFMVGSTMYGTFRSWPKIQFATDQEAYAIYARYNLRANIVFVVGIAGAVCGLLLSRKEIWFPS